MPMCTLRVCRGLFPTESEKALPKYVVYCSFTKRVNHRPVNKGDSRQRHLQGKGEYTGLVRQALGFSLFDPM